MTFDYEQTVFDGHEYTFEPPAWYQQAACRGMDGRLFFAERGEDVRPAKATCARCPVQPECLEVALATPQWGIWGGMSERERRLHNKRLRLAGEM